MQRIIMHIDMNSYFASCEQQDRLEWRNKPLGVCEHLGGIIIAPSVEAKRWGVKTGMPVWEAKKLCPHIILTNTNPDRYRMYTARFLQLLEEYTDSLDRYSIDEAFLDVTKVCNVQRRMLNAKCKMEWQTADPFAEAARMAQEIKMRITHEVGDYLRCSVGIATDKLVAKIASDMQKPDGLVVVRPEDKERLYATLALTDIPGIGTRQARRLLERGIRTLRDLRNCPISHLYEWFGILGYHLWSMGQLQGSWQEGFETPAPLRSVGHMYTVAREFRVDHLVAERVLSRLSEMVAKRLRALGLGAQTVGAWMTNKEYEAVGGQVRLDVPVQGGRAVFQAGKRAILRHTDGQWPWPVYRVGVTAFGLQPVTGTQLDLFAVSGRQARADAAMDLVNAKYSSRERTMPRFNAALGSVPDHACQDDVLLPAPAFFARSVIHDSVGFGRMKEFRVADFKRGG